MPALEIGQVVPDFTAPATSETTFTLSDYRGVSNVIIYFYPKDSTPGCTTEGQNFRDMKEELASNDTIVFGVSKDTMRRHENFKAKQEFNFELISDESEEVCNLFNVIQLKKLYGKEYMGIVRSTFLIDKEGVLREHWDKVRVKGHTDRVLESVKAL
ncbi:peroxiredoxin [Leucothrix arctica]|uniref:thioredoxin-dependent peroxiredoxin n=1 Tax=Leucothrix arctica TaxID=1481894 RepID=A0A317C658_9GAMM|nr:peroxiredoxin [Leucothrix arctica]PWQ94088.1 peroxiredoxin [Leucothrix arctica]